MEERGPFVSVSSGIDNNSYNFDALHKIAYIGQSQDKLYWNKRFSSLGLICGSFHETINPVTRWLASAHLTKEHDTAKSPRILVFHTDHHALCPTPCAVLNTKHVFGSPRTTSNSPNRRPLRLQEQDVSLRHVLALFTPPPDMHNASSSRLMTSIQYVISQLQAPFDLQAFIQLLEQEKWDEEGSTFVALRQTMLTELLSPDETMRAGGMTHGSLCDLKRVIIDLSDPILCTMRLDAVLMDMILHAFLKQSAIDERTMVVLNAAHEYLSPSSPLLHTLESLVSHQLGTTSVLITTTNLPTLTMSPAISNAIDYIAITSPIRIPEWLNALKKHSIPVETMKSYFPARNSHGITLISHESQHLEHAEAGDYWTGWGNPCVSLNFEGILQATSRPNLEDSDLRENSEATVGYTSIPNICDIVADRMRDSQNLKGSEEAALGGIEDEEVKILPEKTSLKIYDQSSQPAPEDPGATEDPISIAFRTQSLNEGKKSLVHTQDFNTEDNSDSDHSYNGHDHPTIDLSGMTFSKNGNSSANRAFFNLASDLPPVAFIVTPVTANMYPENFSFLVQEILRSSGGYSNIAVPKNQLKSKINPIIKSRKAQGSSLGFRNFNKMLRRAWMTNIVRKTMEDSVFLANPPSIWTKLNQPATTGSLLMDSTMGIGGLPADPRTRTISPFLPIVEAIAHYGGGIAKAPVPLKSVREHFGAGEITALGFFRFPEYLREAVRLRLVEIQRMPGVQGRAVALRMDSTHLRSLLILQGDPDRPAANR